MEKDFLIRFDYAIKHILRNKANFGILEGFIEVFLSKKCKILEILESEGNQDDADDKYNRVDIKAKDTNGEIFIVEVQTTRYTFYLERILYGVSKAVTEQMTSGNNYDHIKQVFSISIVYYDLGTGDDYFYECKSDFIGVHTHNPLQLSRREELTVEEIRQIKETTGKDQKYRLKKMTSSDVFPKYYLIRINAFRKIVADAMDEWMSFLKDNSIKLGTTAPGLAEAREKLLVINMPPEERYRYERRIEALCNERDAKAAEEEEKFVQYSLGVEQGRAEGERKAKLETARVLKSLNLPIDQIVKATQLDQSEIENL